MLSRYVTTRYVALCYTLYNQWKKESRLFIHSWIEWSEQKGQDRVNSGGSNHHIPFTGRSTGGYRTIKIWKSPRKIRATEFDFVDIRNECPSLVTPSIRITKNLLFRWKCSLTWHTLPLSSISFFFRRRMSRSTFSEKRKNARNESVEDDNWEKSRLFDVRASREYVESWYPPSFYLAL